MYTVHHMKKLLQFSFWVLIAMLLIIPIQMMIYIAFPPPTTGVEFLVLFQQNWFIGLLSLDLLYIINNTLLLIIYFSLTILLYKHTPMISLLALLLGAVGVATYYGSNPAFEMLFMSQVHANATLDYSIYLATIAEGLLFTYIGTGFISYYILNAIALFLYAYAFYQTPDMPRSLAIWALISAILMTVPSSFGLVGMIFALASLIPWIVFCIRLARYYHHLIHHDDQLNQFIG